MQELPSLFIEHMKALMGDEYGAFEESLSDKRSFGLRINPLKISKKIALEHVDTLGIVRDVPWAEEGFYYDEDYRPGKSPLHEAGAIYIQEPSAMSVVAALDPKPGEIICDMCAAPGGKTTHIAGRMNGKGTLVSNEYVADRAKILARNVERMGIRNCFVVNETPDSMAAHFSSFFDKMVVDAPCSGEGMFRKEEAAISEWSLENVSMCAERQKEILGYAASMVKPGGTLVYSTCTFEPMEDECIIADFLQNNNDWEIVPTGLSEYLEPGRPEWIPDSMNIEESIRNSLVLANRIWPHKVSGEGHFLAKLVKKGDKSGYAEAKIKCSDRGMAKKCMEFLHTELFLDTDKLEINDINRINVSGEHVYLRPEYLADYNCKGLRIVRGGLELIENVGNHIQPAHALAMALKQEDVKYYVDLTEEESLKYLHGETVNTSEKIPNGTWVLVTVDGTSIGWGKHVNGIIKNHIPKGIRIKY